MPFNRENIELTSTGSLVPTEQNYLALTHFSRFQFSDDPFYEVQRISDIIDKPDFSNWALFESFDCGKLFADCFHQLSIIISDLDYASGSIRSRRNSNNFQSYLTTFHNILKKSNQLLLRSLKFNCDFSENKGLISIFSFLKNKNFFHIIKSKEMLEFLKSLIEHLCFQSRYVEKDQKLWLHFNVFESLLEIIRIQDEPCETVDFIRIAACTIMANIGTDKQIEQLNEQENKPIYHLVFDSLMGELKEFTAELLNPNPTFELQHIQFYDDGQLIVRPIACIRGQSLSGKLLALYRLASNNRAANLFFEDMQPISLIIKHGQELEKKFALRLLTQLCFHGNHSWSILNDQSLYKEIIKLSKRELDEFDVKSLLKAVKRTIYVYHLLNESLQNSRRSSVSYIEPLHFKEPNKSKNAQPHILISSTERFKTKPTPTNEIIKHLDISGFKTYLNWNCDIKAIGSSMYNASCVIYCITQSYSLDEFCRFEALHSIKLNKPIIPVILKDRLTLDQEKEWLLEIIIPNQPYVWFDEGLNAEGFARLRDKIHLYHNERNGVFDEYHTNIVANNLKRFIHNLGIRKRKCYKIVVNANNTEMFVILFVF